MNYVFVLGGFDPEMEEICRVLDAAGYPWRRATLRGRPVRAAEAYHADGVDGLIPVGHSVVLVECEVLGLPFLRRVDHHRPGDPGYGKTPEDYLAGSSLGQVLALLGQQPTAEQRIIAAADHCLQHAYRGRCPGVAPEDLARWRMASRAQRLGLPVPELETRVAQAITWLQDAPRIELAGHPVVWLGTAEIAEVAEASARTGIPFIGIRQDCGRWKASLMSAPPPVVEHYLAECGLTDCYGDPQRGFAGGYYA